MRRLFGLIGWLMACLKGWRTMLLNTLVLIMPILELSEITAVMPDGWQPWYVIVVALGNMMLRSLTTTPVGVK